MRAFIPLILFLFLFLGCARLISPVPALNLHEAAEVLHEIACSAEEIKSYFATGAIIIRDDQEETRLGFFFAGTRQPLRLKVEITHSWGREVLDGLLVGERLQVMDYVKKRRYEGPWAGSLLGEVLPDTLAPEHLWALLCGTIPLLDYDSFRIQGPDMVLLLDEGGRIVQAIRVDTRHMKPFWTGFPGTGIEVWFRSIQRDPEGLLFAKKVRIDLPEQGRSVTISFKTLTYNHPIPKEIFEFLTNKRPYNAPCFASYYSRSL